VAGDLTSPGLGLSADDEAELKENIQVVLHSAADVKFDRKLSEAFAINVEGTRHVLELASAAKQLSVFLHVSTAYAHCNRKHMDDRIFTEESELAAATSFTLAGVQEMEEKPGFNRQKYLGTWPNTYCYTKVNRYWLKL